MHAMLRNRVVVRLGLATLVAIAVGCGGAGYGEVPVTGVVTLDGQPLAGVQLTFQPVAKDSSGFAPGSFGRTDEEGNFALRTVWPDAAGAVPGTHRVTIAYDDPAMRPQGVVIPREYREGKATFEVPEAGIEDAVINLEPRR